MFSQRFSIFLPAYWQLCPYVLVKSSACLILTDPRKIRYIHLYSMSLIQYHGVLMTVQNDLLTDHAIRKIFLFCYWWIWALSIFWLTLKLKYSALPGIFKRLLTCLWTLQVLMLFQDKQQYSVAQVNILNSLSQVLFEIVDILSFGTFENVHVCPKTNKMNTHGRINPPTHRCSLWTSRNFFSSGTWQKMKVLQEAEIPGATHRYAYHCFPFRHSESEEWNPGLSKRYGN